MGNKDSFLDAAKQRPVQVSTTVLCAASIATLLESTNPTEASTYNLAEADGHELLIDLAGFGDSQAKAIDALSSANPWTNHEIDRPLHQADFIDSLLTAETSEFSDILRAAIAERRDFEAAMANAVATETIDDSAMRSITVSPDIDFRGNNLTFAHVSGPVAITRQETPEGIKTLVTAHIGIDTDNHQLTQVEQDPRGMHQIGDEFLLGDAPDVEVSENARVAVLFGQNENGSPYIQEMQIGVGYDMRSDRPIEFNLIAPDGTVLNIDASQYQLVEERAASLGQGNGTADYLVFVIKDDAELLGIVLQNMLAEGEFHVEASSHLGREVVAGFDFGDGFEQHLNAGVQALQNPQFFFTMTDEFNLRAEYDINGPEVTSPSAESCLFLNLSDAQKEEARIILGQITDGTGIYPRNFEAHIALDAEGNAIAVGNPFMSGFNLQSNTATISGSALTTFVTEGGTVLNGCTPDYVTTIIPRTPPPALQIPGTPNASTNPATTNASLGSLTFIDFDSSNDDHTRITHNDLPQVPGPFAGVLLLTALGMLSAVAGRRNKVSPGALQELSMRDTSKELVL